MKRAVLLGLLLAAGSISMTAAYQRNPATPAANLLEVEKLRDNLFVLRNEDSGGNTAVFITASGVAVVDTKNPGWGQPILDKIRELTDKPVTTIINTHAHADHLSGNVEFSPVVDVVVHANTAANLKRRMEAPDAKPTIFQANKGRGLPKRTFESTLTLGSGNDRIELRYFGRGHTNGDAWVVFPALRVMHAGDMFSRKGVPLIDGNNGGSGVEFPATLSRAADYAKNIDTIISGHSAHMTVADLREYAAFNRDFLDAVRAALKTGTSSDDFAKRWKIPEKYSGYQAPDPARVKANADVIMAEQK
jgi:glyoxylase-like metal-dependent hydrolase (beta-lactamase superfamily II)